MLKTKLTAGRVANFQCEAGAAKSFLWDSTAPGLALCVTAAGSRSFIFQAKLGREAIRIKIGDPKTWDIDAAQAEARRLRVIIDQGVDPRQVKVAEQEAAQSAREAKQAEAKAKQSEIERHGLTLAEVWPIYVNARKSKWSAGHLQNHMTLTAMGGEQKKRGTTVTVAGPMAPLMPLALADLTGARVAAWLEKEAADRPTNAAQSYRLLRAFIRWAADIPAYAGIVATDAYTARTVRDVLPKSNTKEGDCLQREQLPLWFDAVRKIENPIISSYLQILLLTGARRGEIAAMKWKDVDFQWLSLTILDKIEESRVIPLTPYVAHLLRELKRQNDTPPNVRQIRKLDATGKVWSPSCWVFNSPKAESGHIEEPRIAHTKAIAVAGLPHVSLHGLRRSFGTLSEWTEAPVGVVAQIQGHAPSALAEKHYRRRPLDLLRMWHVKIEAWILVQAGIEFTPAQAGLRVVSTE